MPRPVSLSIDLLETFIRLTRNDGDAARTARELQINQPSMSKRIRYLQYPGQPLERPWLMRVGKRWRLTEEGERVLPAVREIIRRYEQLTQFLDEPVGSMIRLAGSEQDAQGFMAHAVQQFRQQTVRQSHFACTRFHVATIPEKQRVENVANGFYDLATVTLSESKISAIARRPMSIEPLFEERFVAVSGQNSAWADRFRRLAKTKTPAEALGEFPLILPPRASDFRTPIDFAFEDAGLAREIGIVLETSEITAVGQFVDSGLGVAVLTDSMLPTEHDWIVRHLDRNQFPPREVQLLCRRRHKTDERDLSEPAEELAKIIRRVAKRRKL